MGKAKKEAVFWDGLSVRPRDKALAVGSLVFFVHNGEIVRGRVSEVLGGAEELRGFKINNAFLRMPRQVAETAEQLILKSIVQTGSMESGYKERYG
jgi:hypothetical protein